MIHDDAEYLRDPREHLRVEILRQFRIHGGPTEAAIADAIATVVTPILMAHAPTTIDAAGPAGSGEGAGTRSGAHDGGLACWEVELLRAGWNDDKLAAKLRHPVVKAVADLVADLDGEHRRAEAAHDLKDEANRRWLEVTTERDRLRELVGDENQPGWDSCSRAEAIRQANEFHADRKNWMDLFEQVKAERDDLRREIKAVRELCELDDLRLGDTVGSYAIDLALEIRKLLDGAA